MLRSLLRSVLNKTSACNCQVYQFFNRPISISQAALKKEDFTTSRDRKDVFKKAHDARLDLKDRKFVDETTEEKDMLPTLDTYSTLFNGVRFDELPIAYITSSRNNTFVVIQDHKGRKFYGKRSCGMEGFRNAKKSSSVAAEAVGLTTGTLARRQFGIHDVRVVLRGVGSGRLPSLMGLKHAGLNIVSVTDDTKIFFGQRKPRKPRRL